MHPRAIKIRPVLNGFIVDVGCQTVVFDSPQKLGIAIAEYYTNPAAMEAKFIKDKVNNTMEGPHPVLSDEALNRVLTKMPEPIRPAQTECCDQELVTQSPRGPR